MKLHDIPPTLCAQTGRNQSRIEPAPPSVDSSGHGDGLEIGTVLGSVG